MAYNYYPNYFPMYPNGIQMPSTASNLPSNASSASGGGILWVQGENAAKAYPVASGQSVLLMDSEESVFYIKSTDQSGMPQPLRIFDYSERKSLNTNARSEETASEYVSRKEFNAFRDDMQKAIDGFRKPSKEEGEG